MTKETASRVLEEVFAVSAKLNASVQLVQDAEPDEVFQQYRKAVGSVMGEILFAILKPVLAEHPDLAPDWWEG